MMYQSRKTYVTSGMRISDMIFENPSLLIMIEHFGIGTVMNDKSVNQLCFENQINEKLFILIANLYNGFNPESTEELEIKDIKTMISFLKQSHEFYLYEKIPEINSIISRLKDITVERRMEIRLVEDFFNEYSMEVKEHLDYEDHIAFPYFWSLLDSEAIGETKTLEFSVDEYQDHHTDIETKLNELKSLLVKHIPLNNERSLKRKLLLNLFELEFDLNVHSVIEELMLMPLIKRIENKICE